MDVALFFGLVVEVGVAMVLFGWAQALAGTQPGRPAPAVDCDACITGADVTSFLTSDGMCRPHQAHWRLQHDLEAQVWGT